MTGLQHETKKEGKIKTIKKKVIERENTQILYPKLNSYNF